MDNQNKLLSCQQVKQRDMVEYLSRLGYEPAKVKGNDYWYLSPLRTERTASFKVNRKLNRWFDHGLGKGGNLVDFGILYHHCSVKEFLEKFDAHLSFQQPPFTVDKKENEPVIKIISVIPVTSLFLLRYMQQRRIAAPVVETYCKEVHFTIGEKKYSAIGFVNDKGGYELRNQWFKGSSAPKTITTLNNESKNVAVFEGFFNFLSFLSIQRNQQFAQSNFLVLNSVSFFEKSRLFMEQHDHVHLYLDRDRTGQNYTRYALSLNGRYHDESRLYEGYKDLNEWTTQIGHSGQKQRLRPK
jgi:DNA primase